MVFDNDTSGIKNLQRSMKLYKSYGLESIGIKFIPIILPKCKDPDEFLKTHGRQEYVDVLNEAKSKVYDLGTTNYYDELMLQNPTLQIQD